MVIVLLILGLAMVVFTYMSISGENEPKKGKQKSKKSGNKEKKPRKEPKK